MKYGFYKKEDCFDDGRAGFVNKVCKLIYQVNGNDVDKAVESGELIFKDFDEYVRNIYELVNNYIPLMEYRHLKKSTNPMLDYDLTNEEYTKRLELAKLACEEFYS